MSSNPAPGKEGGFTLIEVLVVISIIAVLIAMLLPAVKRAKESAHKVLCSNHIRQITLSLNVYAGEHDDQLPRVNNGVWLHDVSYTTSDFVMETGGHRDTFYCPSDPVQSADDPRLWQFTQGPINPNFPPPEPVGAAREGHYRIGSYFWLMDLAEDAGRTRAADNGVTGSAADEIVWATSVYENSPDTPLVTDGTWSDACGFVIEGCPGNGNGLWTLYNMSIPSDHLLGSEPEGGNVAFIDTHVRWRSWQDMQEPRYYYGPQGAFAAKHHW